VIVGAENGMFTEFPQLRQRRLSTGRFLVDLDADPVADHPVLRIPSRPVAAT